MYLLFDQPKFSIICASIMILRCHTIDSVSFKGEISKGEYVAGTASIWTAGRTTQSTGGYDRSDTPWPTLKRGVRARKIQACGKERLVALPNGVSPVTCEVL